MRLTEMLQRKIHLLYLITQYSVGGAEKAMARILSRINRSKYDITVAALRRGSGRLLPELEKTGFRVETLGANRKYDVVRVAFRLYDLMMELGTEVLICSLFHPTILGRLAGKLTRGPVIVNWEHSVDFGGLFRVLLNKITIPLSDKVLCDSEKVAKELQKRLHPPSSLIKIIPIGGIDLAQYGYRERDRHRRIEIGSVGRLVEQKGYSYLIEAARIVLEEVGDVSFSIVGDGPELRNLQKLITEFELSGRVNLLGFQSDIPSVLTDWDIYVQPSVCEGLCLTVVEAVASGLPIVATSVGGIPESVVDCYNGFLVPPKSPEALAAKILDLVEEPNLRAEMGRRSREIAEEKYSLDKMVKNIEEAIDALIGQRTELVCRQDL